MSETSNNPYKNLTPHDRDVEASAASFSSPLPSPNPFLDPPNVPPPAYNFHADERNLFLPPNTTISRSRSPSPYPSPNPFKRSESPTAAYYRRQQYNKRRFICFMVAIIVMIVIALIVAGVALKWGRNNVCVHWNDGTSSGNCDN